MKNKNSQFSSLNFQFSTFNFQLEQGQSIIEFIIAVAILAIIAGSTVTVILGAFSTTRLAEEETQATFFATEGIEAVQSIRNQNWDGLVNGDPHGLTKSGGIWTFFGTSDDPDGTGKFTRTIAIADVQRNSEGKIVESGGTVDPDSKKVTSTITWDFTPSRQNEVELTVYLTNWQLARSPAGASGPEISSCSKYCETIGYSSGTCRQDTQTCLDNSEEHKPVGDQYCPGEPDEDTCCCGL